MVQRRRYAKRKPKTVMTNTLISLEGKLQYYESDPELGLFLGYIILGVGGRNKITTLLTLALDEDQAKEHFAQTCAADALLTDNDGETTGLHVVRIADLFTEYVEQLGGGVW